MNKACYRKLMKYEYQLMDDYIVQTDIKPAQDIVLKFLSLSSSGVLAIKKFYA
jgi:hypothetical protein